MKRFLRCSFLILGIYMLLGAPFLLIGQERGNLTDNGGVLQESTYPKADTGVQPLGPTELNQAYDSSTTISAPLRLATDPLPIDYGEAFATFAALVGAIPIVVEFLKKFMSDTAPKWIIQALSWITGIALTMVGYYFDLGFLAEIEVGTALLYGFGASLAANGVADTKLIQWFFTLFGKKK